MDADTLWVPEHSAFTESLLAKFAIANGFTPQDYETLHRWSVSDLESFWGAVWDFTGVVGEKGSTAYVPSENQWMTGARFFPEARLNLIETLLQGADGDIVVHSANEGGGNLSLTRVQLREMVARVADGLRSLDVKCGDMVAGVQPNTIDALVSMLATLSIGAVWSSCSPDFGTTAIIDRIGQVNPKVLFAAPQYRYSGKLHDISDRVSDLVEGISSIHSLILSGPSSEVPLKREVDVLAQAEFGRETPIKYHRVPFDHPIYVLYTSGTTGKPKAIVHRTGGVALQHMKEHILHGDVRPGDSVTWYTNTAWMMYPWMVSALGAGASIALYDGAPILKTDKGLDCSPLWSLCETAKLTHLGISPKYMATLQAEGYSPREIHDLSSLRSLLACGAPTLPHQFDWAYEAIKSNMCFASISGGTEILGCFLIGSPIHPVRRGQLTVPALGHAVAVLDDRNLPVIGRRGALVCTEPFPSMPITFSGEGGDQRYRDTYFSEYPETWNHGDIAEMTVTGGAYLHGRADNTLKPGGVRIGASEIYAVCESFSELEDALVFGATHDGDEEVVLCIKPKESSTVTSELVSTIRRSIRTAASPRHVPKRVHVVRDIPYTINGKRVEGAARTAVAGGVVKNINSLANPDCLKEYEQLRREDAL